jgi:hypothetical protein
MAYWAMSVPAGTYAAQRMVHSDTVEPSGLAGADPGDRVALLVEGDPPALFGLGVVRPSAGPGRLAVAYTRRLFDPPLPAPDLAPGPLSAEEYTRLAQAAGMPPDRTEWLVSLSIPIEATSPADAVRQFWSYVEELGPRELPAFVSPVGDELALQAFVLGAPTNLDPEEDED